MSVFIAAMLLTGSFGCAPPTGGSDNQPGSTSTDSLELSDEIIRERINRAFVREVPEETGSAPPITWRFFPNEPKEIAIIDKQIDGQRGVIVLDIKTTSGPRTREPRYLAGQVRTTWELKTGWVLRKWEIVDIENISMTYKNLPKLPPQSPDR